VTSTVHPIRFEPVTDQPRADPSPIGPGPSPTHLETPDVTAIDCVMLFDEDERAGWLATIAASLGAANLTTERCHEPRAAIAELRRVKPAVAVIVGADEPFGGLSGAAKALGIPTLALIEPGDDPGAIAAKVRGFDGWHASPGRPSRSTAESPASSIRRGGRRRSTRNSSD